MKQTIHALSAESQKLKDRLIQGSEGQELDPKEMEAICGLLFDGTSSVGHRRFNQIRWSVLNETDLLWRWIGDRKVYRCLTESEKVDDMGYRSRIICKASKRNVRIGQGLDFGKLSADQQASAAAHMATSALIAAASRATCINRLKKATTPLVHMDESVLVNLMQQKQSVVGSK